MTRRILPLVLLLCAFPLLAKPRPIKPSSIITIGALFSLTGDGATLGAASAAALDLAARDINLEFDALDLPYRVNTIVEDTQLKSAIAAEKIVELHARGASFVIGPQSSAEAGAVRDFANTHGMIVISQGSTASSLAIAGDNLFRLAPNDKLEGAAMAALMRSDGITVMLPMWRDDAGNNGLRNSTKSSFEASGGTTVAGVIYPPATTDFTSQVAALGTALRAIKNQQPSAKVGIYLAAFEEAASIFDLARLDADLSSVRWYGGDGVTQSQALISSPAIARFGVMTNFTAPNVGLDDTTVDRWLPISNEIAAKVGFAGDAYSLSVYDAAWVAALSAAEVQLHADQLRASFVRNVQRYWGLTGPTALDAAGDRKLANFDFWTIRDNDVVGLFQWLRTARYVGGRVVK